MESQTARTELVIGKSGVERIADSAVIVLGIGGVGSYVVEGLARAGIGKLTLVDMDTVDVTNINRQLPALHSTIGRFKAEVMAERVRDINPGCSVRAEVMMFMAEDCGSDGLQGVRLCSGCHRQCYGQDSDNREGRT